MGFSSRIFSRTLLAVALFAVASGCATLKKARLLPGGESGIAAVRADAVRRVGTITLVNEGDRFVLIDTGTAPAPGVGTALKSFTGGTASGVVTVGDVSRRPFVVADIVQGAPLKGDVVYQ